MEVGFKTATHHIDWSTMEAIWRFADASDVYTHGWNFDHFYPIQGDPTGPCLEAWVTLTALARATKRVRVGTMVNGIIYRHPAVLAAMASSLDIVSNGRMELGIGTGWNELECSAYGIPLGSLKERFDRLEEAVQVVRRLLREDVVTFHGEYYSLTDARNEPKGPQASMPICIGGLGERRTLRAVARYADHWNLPEFSADMYAHKRAVLESHCEEVGRDIAEIRTSAHVIVDARTTAVDVCKQIQEQESAGIDQAIVYFQPPVRLDDVVRLTDVLRTEFGKNKIRSRAAVGANETQSLLPRPNQRD